MNERLDYNVIENFANGIKDPADVLRHDIANLEQLIENMQAAQTVAFEKAQADERSIVMDITFVFECGVENDWEYEFEAGEIDKAWALLADLRSKLFEVNKEL